MHLKDQSLEIKNIENQYILDNKNELHGEYEIKINFKNNLLILFKDINNVKKF